MKKSSDLIFDRRVSGLQERLRCSCTVKYLNLAYQDHSTISELRIFHYIGTSLVLCYLLTIYAFDLSLLRDIYIYLIA